MNQVSPDQRVVVFGSGGMAGSAICRALKRNGFDNILTPKRENLDLLDYAEVKRWFIENHPDIVILAAAKVGGIYANNTYPAEFIYENLQIQNNIIHASHVNDVQKLLFLS